MKSGESLPRGLVYHITSVTSHILPVLLILNIPNKIVINVKKFIPILTASVILITRNAYNFNNSINKTHFHIMFLSCLT